ncbi:hypothetical protein HFD88_003770 [Aspergillus terreus]|nr:hypothetical protein HFD88_003770 [Aspergillus terreus]
MNPLIFALALWASPVTSASIPRDWPISNDIDSIRPIGIPPWLVQDKHAIHNPDSFKEVVKPELRNGVIVGDH